MTTTIEGVEISLSRLSSDWRKTAVRVKVASIKKPGLWADNEIDTENAGDAKALINLVGVAAGACCEYLGKRYGDNRDPTAVAKIAMNAFAEECRQQAALSKGMKEKVTRLHSNAELFGQDAQEFIDRAWWTINRDEMLTPAEAVAVDKLIVLLHQAQH